MADRRAFLSYFASVGLGSTLLPGVLWGKLDAAEPDAVITLKMLQDAAAVAGVNFSQQQFERILKGVNENLAKYNAIRAVALDNSIAPPLYFNPVVPGMKIEREKRGFRRSEPARVTRPGNLEQVAFWPVTQLSELLRTKQVKSVELTEMYLARLKRYNPKLLCAVTITEQLALRQARGGCGNCGGEISRAAAGRAVRRERSRNGERLSDDLGSGAVQGSRD